MLLSARSPFQLQRQLRALVREATVTLAYAARDEEHNDAVVLRKVLLR